MQETAEEKLQKICNTIRENTLRPAKEEADQLLAHAEEQRKQILQEAKAQALSMIDRAKEEVARERKVFETSLQQAANQSLETLRQAVERDLFRKELAKMVAEQSGKKEIVADLIHAIIKAIDKEGIKSELEVLIPKRLSVGEMNSALGKKVLARLKKNSVHLGDFDGGVAVKLEGEQVTLDITNEALEALIARFAREDFRKLFFQG